MSEPENSPAAAAGGAYRVLARKYRPWNFDDLIGQEALVRTLTNSFSTGRIAQAWMLTGVRGVGKTTTARILARALNYDLGDGQGAPTVDMPQLGVHCAAIMESRHVDVLEMDAASRTGIDDVREILEGVRYAPASARYKVYIIDEVHMLSDKAFNAFLKTLEEPPPHVKFVFATTEVRKVPVTVLSRCQRFNLRRVDSGVLTRHLEKIVGQEGLTAEEEALALIARAAEGSVRDALSILDQAIAHGGGGVDAEAVRQMLGLSDRGRVVDLFEAVMAGNAAAAMAVFRELYDGGADAAVILTDLAEFVHFVTRVKLTSAALEDPSVTEVERNRGRDFAARLSHRVLARAWQMLAKGISEVQAAPKPAQAADMVLVRLAYAADLPTPDEALKALANGGSVPAGSAAPSSPVPSSPAAPVSAAPASGPSGGEGMARAAMGQGGGQGGAAFAVARSPAPMADPTPVPASAPSAQAAQAPQVRLETLQDAVALAAGKRDIQMKLALERLVRLVHFEDGRIEFQPAAGAPPTLAADIQRKLSDWTGKRWGVVIAREDGQPTLHEQREEEESARLRGVAAHPHVQAVLERFPGAEIVGVRSIAPEAEEGVQPAEETDSEED